MVLKVFFLVLILMVASLSYAAMDSNTYVVHMEKSKMRAFDASVVTSKRWYEAIIQSINLHSERGEETKPEQDQPTSSPQLLYVYETLISGFSAKLSKQNLESLKRVDGFLSATMDELLTPFTQLIHLSFLA